MRTYELALFGYNASVPATDGLIKWINAPSREAVERFITRNRLHLLLNPEKSVRRMECQVLDMEAGVDLIVEDDGRITDKSSNFWHREWAAEVVQVTSTLEDNDVEIASWFLMSVGKVSVILKQPNFDQDEHDERRDIPAGSVGTVVSCDWYDQETKPYAQFGVQFENGGHLFYELDELPDHLEYQGVRV